MIRRTTRAIDESSKLLGRTGKLVEQSRAAAALSAKLANRIPPSLQMKN
jgi:hypothetical protein